MSFPVQLTHLYAVLDTSVPNMSDNGCCVPAGQAVHSEAAPSLVWCSGHRGHDPDEAPETDFKRPPLAVLNSHTQETRKITHPLKSSQPDMIDTSGAPVRTGHRCKGCMWTLFHEKFLLLDTAHTLHHRWNRYQIHTLSTAQETPTTNTVRSKVVLEPAGELKQQQRRAQRKVTHQCPMLIRSIPRRAGHRGQDNTEDGISDWKPRHSDGQVRQVTGVLCWFDGHDMCAG
jgi:hypothetical protein